MKKQVSAILAAGMAASLLVGCGGAASSAASSTAESTSTAASSEAAAATTEAGQAADITLWTYPIGKWGDSESVDALLADFNAKYPICLWKRSCSVLSGRSSIKSMSVIS